MESASPIDTTVPLRLTQKQIVYTSARIALVFFFVSDLLNKIVIIATEDDNPPLSPSKFFRIVFELFALLIIFARFDPKRNLVMTLVAALFGVYALGVVVYLFNYQYPFSIAYHISLFNKYIFAFLVYAFLYKLRDEPQMIDKLMRLCEILFVVNSLLTIIGAVFEIEIFKSYPFQPWRYGYSGVIPAINESSLFYLIALCYAYYKKYLLRRPLGYAILIPIAGLLLGTKAIYGFMIIIVIFHFYRVSGLKSKVFAFIGLLAFSGFVIFLYNSEFAQPVFSFFEELLARQGLVSALLSGRDAYVQTKFFENMNMWTPVNYLIGGQDQLRYLIEMDVFDAFLYFGVIGSVLWYFLAFQTFFSFSLKKKFNLFFVVVYFAMAALGGHFFASAVNSLYLIVFCLFIHSNDKNSRTELK